MNEKLSNYGIGVGYNVWRMGLSEHTKEEEEEEKRSEKCRKERS